MSPPSLLLIRMDQNRKILTFFTPLFKANRRKSSLTTKLSEFQGISLPHPQCSFISNGFFWTWGIHTIPMIPHSIPWERTQSNGGSSDSSLNPARQLQQVVVSASKYQESNLELPFASGALFMLDRVCQTIGQVTQVRQVTPLEAPDFSVCPVCDFRLPAKVENDARWKRERTMNDLEWLALQQCLIFRSCVILCHSSIIQGCATESNIKRTSGEFNVNFFIRPNSWSYNSCSLPSFSRRGGQNWGSHELSKNMFIWTIWTLRIKLLVTMSRAPHSETALTFSLWDVHLSIITTQNYAKPSSTYSQDMIRIYPLNIIEPCCFLEFLVGWHSWHQQIWSGPGVVISGSVNVNMSTFSGNVARVHWVHCLNLIK